MSPKPSLGSVLCESTVEFLAERVLFQDDAILAVDKPEGVAAIPGGGEQESVLTQLQDSLFGKLFVVHRLDKEVSGVMIFARTPQAHRSLSRQFSAHQAQKTYVALVHGELADNDGLIDKPLRAFGSGRVGVCEDGKPSVTRFAVVERLQGYTLLHVYPRTGRRHQIRVHLYADGHPIVGDRRYGDREIQGRYPRLMLHAWRLTLVHPDGRMLEMTAEPPGSFVRVLESLRH